MLLNELGIGSPKETDLRTILKEQSQKNKKIRHKKKKFIQELLDIKKSSN